ncbi:MAG: hypothetical protein F2793_07325 [Actinobacteria bacterium]|uniref:Unannotated protein n=1 Tax=freshwater metagenome TaxID=449393 RepID=A0A6J7EGS8_9ZZZZ|nr:hypothetical protein [Actinomycetota bacterium]
MPESPLDFARQWVEFVDPADEDQLIRADLTWLTSRWTCIFGRGCQGIYADRPDVGCCALGAHFSEKADEKRVATWVEKLDSSVWQRIDIGRKKGWSVKEGTAYKTRVVGDACIFHNDKDFEGGYGCALHHLAQREGVSFIETKPEVCWQLPLRRTYDNAKHEDGVERLVVVLGEYDRRAWGEGGHDLDWYCSSNTDAHIGTEPVYRSSRDEIVALIGQPAYDELARICDSRSQLLLTVADTTALSPHPADPA